MDTMTKITDTAIALSKFEEAAIKHSEATQQGDYKMANSAYAILRKIYAFLKEQSDIQMLSQFLDHPSTGVRLWAATYLLPVSESEGLKVLRQITKEPGIHSLTAKTTVDEWLKGALKL
ncbi:DUF2019 domain-containing protein [Pararcticibacter amylolyticus]